MSVVCISRSKAGPGSATNFRSSSGGLLLYNTAKVDTYQFIAGFSLRADCFDGWHLVRPFANCTEKKIPTVVLNISR